MKVFYKIVIIASVITLSTLSIANVVKATNQQPILKNKEVVQPISENKGANDQYEDRIAKPKPKKKNNKEKDKPKDALKKALKEIGSKISSANDDELDRIEEELRRIEKEIEKIEIEVLKEAIRIKAEALKLVRERQEQIKRCLQIKECRNGMENQFLDKRYL